MFKEITHAKRNKVTIIIAKPVEILSVYMLGVIYYSPVLPNPPFPRVVSDSFVTFFIFGIIIGWNIN